VFYKTLSRFSYLSILGTFIPVIVALVILLIHFSISELIWMLALDSLIVTSLLVILLLIDSRNLEKEIYKT